MPKAGQIEWMHSHAAIPIADQIDHERLRIYFSSRDKKGRSIPTYIEVRADNPQELLYVHERPLLPLGELGTFDDNGIMPSWIVNFGAKKYLYYIGWNPQVTVSYRLSVGLAISEDGGKNFEKYSHGPICDRSVDEPYFNTAPCVLLDGEKWKMWYVSCTGWKEINGWPEPCYHVKFAESNDGINWERTGHVCIDYDNFAQAIGRPCVYKEDNIFKMLYSYRGATNYRTDRNQSYRIGYAESADGVDWTRKDDLAGIDRSEQGWDADMIEYCFVHSLPNRKTLLYNGNGFGQSGFGYAIMSND